jgi:hypothetical protein
MPITGNCKEIEARKPCILLHERGEYDPWRVQHLSWHKSPIELAVRMDNSPCHNGQKVVNKMRPNHMICLDYPPYSPDLSPRGFWLFGVLKNRMKETVFRNSDEVEDYLSNL